MSQLTIWLLHIGKVLIGMCIEVRYLMALINLRVTPRYQYIKRSDATVLYFRHAASSPRPSAHCLQLDGDLLTSIIILAQDACFPTAVFHSRMILTLVCFQCQTDLAECSQEAILSDSFESCLDVTGAKRSRSVKVAIV